MKSHFDFEAVIHALNVALLRITNNRVHSFIFIVLALILSFLGGALFWELLFNALLRDPSG